MTSVSQSFATKPQNSSISFEKAELCVLSTSNSNCLNLSTSNGNAIPLTNIEVSMMTHNHITEYTLIQSYKNTELQPIETFYTFPTPAGASVFDFFAKIGDRIIKTSLKDKDTARDDYNKAVSRGHGAYLMESSSGDIFHVSLGNMLPGAEIDIVIKYIIEAKTEIDASKLRFNFPLTIMPKYTSKNDTNTTRSTLANPPKVNKRPYKLSLSGTVSLSDGIVNIDSKTHKIKLSNMEKNKLDFEINDIENLDEDVIITVTRNMPKSSCLTQECNGLANPKFKNATMINIVPAFDKINDTTIDDVHYVILLDKSGSMKDDDMENCREGAKIFLLSLPVNASYDIYKFDSDYTKFFPVNEKNKLSEAIEWINKIDASGGTELFAALSNVYNSIKESGKQGAVLLLSDGGVSNTEDVLKLAKKNSGTSIFSIGIGQSVSQELIEGLASASGGKAEFVNSGNDQIKDKIAAQLKRSQSVLRKQQKNNAIELDIDGPYQMVPEKIPTLFEGDLNTVFVFSENPIKNVKYSQQFNDYTLNANIPMETINGNNYPLHKMAGIKTISELLNNASGSQAPHLKTDPYKTEIIAISTDLGILSKYTSFVGVEIREEVDAITKQPVFREIPLETPKKYKQSNFYESRSRSAAAFSVQSFNSSAFNSSFDMLESCNISRMSSGVSKGMKMKESMKYAMSSDEEADSNDLFDNIPKSASRTTSRLSYSHNPAPESKSISKGLSKGPSTPQYKVTATISKLPTFVVSGNLLSSTSTGLLAIDKIKVGDYISVTGEGKYSGIYKVWNLGSQFERWVLERVN